MSDLPQIRPASVERRRRSDRESMGRANRDGPTRRGLDAPVVIESDAGQHHNARELPMKRFLSAAIAPSMAVGGLLMIAAAVLGLGTEFLSELSARALLFGGALTSSIGTVLTAHGAANQPGEGT